MPVQRQEILSGLDAPAYSAYEITPNDSTDLPAGDTRAIYIGGDGNLAVITAAGNSVTFVGLKAGSVLPVRASRVKSTGTTATSLIALG